MTIKEIIWSLFLILVFFLLFTAFKKSVENYLTPDFDFLLLKNFTLKSEILFSVNGRISKSPLHKRLRLVFVAQKVMALRIVNFLIFDRFLNLFDFS